MFTFSYFSIWCIQEKKEKEALAAEDGWTVVVHHKGRKKTTDSETGIAVGSVSQAAVMDNVAKKKNKDVGLDFYRFQKREAKRNGLFILSLTLLVLSASICIQLTLFFSIKIFLKGKFEISKF